MTAERLPGSPVEPRPLRSSLDRVVGSLGGPSVGTLQAVFGRWDELVGPHVAPHARPVALRDRRLLVAVDEPAWATEIRYLEAGLLAGIAAVTGEGQVVAVDVRVQGAGHRPC